MSIPRTIGYTEIVKIAEAALNSDPERARRFMKKYIDIYPDKDLVYPFTALLNAETNPSALHLLKLDNMIERKIGETFFDGEVELKVVKQNDDQSCRDCYYYSKQTCAGTPKCSAGGRSDKTHVIFKQTKE